MEIASLVMSKPWGFADQPIRLRHGVLSVGYRLLGREGFRMYVRM